MSTGEGIGYPLQYFGASLVAQMVKKSTCNAGDPGSIPGLGRSTGEGIGYPLQHSWASLVAGKKSACHAGNLGLIPGLGRSPGKGNGYSLQYSGLQNSMNCTVHGVTKSQTQLSNFHFHFLHILGAALLFIIILDKGN